MKIPAFLLLQVFFFKTATPQDVNGSEYSGSDPMKYLPSRIREGMVLLSGDVLLLFNPLQIDYNNVGAAAISFKENVETGKNHGVYLNGPDGKVKCCLQKKSVEVLQKAGTVNESGCVDIDTGALIFSTDIMKSLYSLIETDADYDRNVNERTRLSLYADFLYPLASDSTLCYNIGVRPHEEEMIFF